MSSHITGNSSNTQSSNIQIVPILPKPTEKTLTQKIMDFLHNLLEKIKNGKNSEGIDLEKKTISNSKDSNSTEAREFNREAQNLKSIYKEQNKKFNDVLQNLNGIKSAYNSDAINSDNPEKFKKDLNKFNEDLKKFKACNDFLSNEDEKTKKDPLKILKTKISKIKSKCIFFDKLNIELKTIEETSEKDLIGKVDTALESENNPLNKSNLTPQLRSNLNSSLPNFLECRKTLKSLTEDAGSLAKLEIDIENSRNAVKTKLEDTFKNTINTLIDDINNNIQLGNTYLGNSNIEQAVIHYQHAQDAYFKLNEAYTTCKESEIVADGFIEGKMASLPMKEANLDDTIDLLEKQIAAKQEIDTVAQGKECVDTSSFIENMKFLYQDKNTYFSNLLIGKNAEELHNILKILEPVDKMQDNILEETKKPLYQAVKTQLELKCNQEIQEKLQKITDENVILEKIQKPNKDEDFYYIYARESAIKRLQEIRDKEAQKASKPITCEDILNKINHENEQKYIKYVSESLRTALLLLLKQHQKNTNKNIIPQLKKFETLLKDIKKERMDFVYSVIQNLVEDTTSQSFFSRRSSPFTSLLQAAEKAKTAPAPKEVVVKKPSPNKENNNNGKEAEDLDKDFQPEVFNVTRKKKK